MMYHNNNSDYFVTTTTTTEILEPYDTCRKKNEDKMHLFFPCLFLVAAVELNLGQLFDNDGGVKAGGLDFSRSSTSSSRVHHRQVRSIVHRPNHRGKLHCSSGM